MNAATRKQGRKLPPKELLAAALIICQNDELTWKQVVGVLRRAASRMGLEHRLPERLHINTVRNWVAKARDLGLTLADAGPLFQIIREGEEEGAEL